MTLYASDETEDAITLTLVMATRLEQEIDRCSQDVRRDAFCVTFRFFRANFGGPWTTHSFYCVSFRARSGADAGS